MELHPHSLSVQDVEPIDLDFTDIATESLVSAEAWTVDPNDNFTAVDLSHVSLSGQVVTVAVGPFVYLGDYELHVLARTANYGVSQRIAFCVAFDSTGTGTL
jgi:hypothetical protein